VNTEGYAAFLLKGPIHNFELYLESKSVWRWLRKWASG
jgi:hypothetical protein